MTRPERVAFVAAAALLVALAVDVVWCAPWVPAQDMPGHIFGALARAHLDDPAFDHARFLVANEPVSTRGLIDGLEPLLGWRDAYRAATTVLVLVWMLAAAGLVQAAHRDRAWLALLAASTAFGWSFYMGFFAFCFGTALGFGVVAFALARPAPSVAQRALLSGLLLVAALAHFFAAALAGFVWLIVAVARAPAGAARSREAGYVALGALPAALLTVATSTGAVGASEGGHEVLPWSLRLLSWGAATIGGPAWRQAPLLLAMAVAVVAIVALRGRARVDRALVGSGALFLLVPLVVPWSAASWQHLAPRPLPFAAVLLCAAVPLERATRRVRAVVAVACVASAFAATLWARQLHVASNADPVVVDLLRAVDAPLGPAGEPPRAAGYRWPLVLVQPRFVDDAALFRWDPLRGVGGLFGATQGGFPAYAFVNSPTSDAVLLRDDARASLAPPLLRSRFVTPVRTLVGEARRARVDLLAVHAVQVDGVVVIEEPADHVVWQRRGYVADVEAGGVLLAHFEGCALDLAHGAGDVVVRPSPASADRLARSEAVHGDAHLQGVWCGPVEVVGCGAVRTVTLSRDVTARVDCAAGPTP